MSRRRLYPVLPGGILSEARIVASATINDCDITTTKLADSAVTTVKLNNSGVTAVKLADTYIISGDSRVLTSHIQDSGVTTVKINNDAVTNAKIADSAIMTAKISDSQITTAKILDSNVTYAKIQAVTATRLLGRHDTTSGIVQEVVVGGGLFMDTSNDAVAATRIIELNVTDTTLTTGDGKIKFNIPSDMDSWDLIDADACVDTNTSATVGPTFQIRNATQAADMLSTKITIDTGEVTSFTAATQPVIDTANDSVVTGDRIEIDIDSAGIASGLRIITAWRKF